MNRTETDEGTALGKPVRARVTVVYSVEGDQPLRQRPADALTALDSPHPLRELPTRREQQPIALGVGAEPTQHRCSPSPRTSIVADRLCGSIPITTRAMCLASFASIDVLRCVSTEEGRAISSWSDHLWSHSSSAVPDETHAM